MPLALPGIIATAIFTFIVAWNDFLFAMVLIGQDELKTLAIGINEFSHMAVVDWGLIIAAGVMVTIPALVFFIAIQRYLIAGWGAGGLQGLRRRKCSAATYDRHLLTWARCRFTLSTLRSSTRSAGEVA
jgi:ABC-type Fe3+ transport system permease subunit